MKISANYLHNISFGKVIPVKKVVFDNDGKIKGEQITLDEFYSSEREHVDTTCDEETSKKVVQALNRILAKNDGAEKSTFKNALNNMIRTAFAQADKDYKIPSRPIEGSENNPVKPSYSKHRTYLLTGQEAREYAAAGKNIGGARALVRDFNESQYVINKSQKDFAYVANEIISDPKARLKGDFGQNLGIVIYADKVNVARKGSKGVKTEIDIRGIDFEPL